jgi:hypothetical protein
VALGQVVSGGFFAELISGGRKCGFTGGYCNFVVHLAGKSWSICGALYGERGVLADISWSEKMRHGFDIYFRAARVNQSVYAVTA